MTTETTDKPIALLTNDDGVNSHFLYHLANAMEAYFEVIIAAPAEEKSWIGRAMTRRESIQVKPFSGYRWKTWAIKGTPSDCVNIALGHLLPRLPSIVVSGINIGYNTSIPLIYSSGTIAGAMEGAFWGIPSIASSQDIPSDLFEKIAESKGKSLHKMDAIVEQSARHTAKHAKELIENSEPSYALVHNLNYPSNLNNKSQLKITKPAHLEGLSLYANNDANGFNFQYVKGHEKSISELTDRDAIEAGDISLSLLDFKKT